MPGVGIGCLPLSLTLEGSCHTGYPLLPTVGRQQRSGDLQPPEMMEGCCSTQRAGKASVFRLIFVAERSFPLLNLIEMLWQPHVQVLLHSLGAIARPYHR